MLKVVCVVFVLSLLSACARQSPSLLQLAFGNYIPPHEPAPSGPFGYIPPPAQQTFLERWTQLFELCLAAGGDQTCIKNAQDEARAHFGVKPPRRGTVTVREVRDSDETSASNNKPEETQDH